MNLIHIIKSIIPNRLVNLLRAYRTKVNSIDNSQKFHIDPSCKVFGWWEPAHIKMKLNPSDWIQGQILLRGGYEKEYVKKLGELLPEKGVFFDVGSNIGVYSLNMFRKAEVVYAFEATETTYNLLNETINDNNINNIFLNLLAVHNKDGEVVNIYSVIDSNIGGNSMYNGSILVNTVQTITLDTFVQKNNIKRIDIIKLDIEGNELNALKGAKESIRKYKPILFCEINPTLNVYAGYDASELYDYLCKELKYIAKESKKNGYKKISKRKAISRQNNIYFFPSF